MIKCTEKGQSKTPIYDPPVQKQLVSADGVENQANTTGWWGSKGRGVGMSHLLPAAVAAAASGIVGEETSGIC